MGVSYNLIMNEVHNGTLCSRFPYQTIETKDSFLRMLNTLSENEWTIEQKWDGWWAVLCEFGLFSKTGNLIRNDLKVPRGTIYVGEYLHGTQWALKRQDKLKMAVHWATGAYGSPIPSEIGFWMPRFSFNDIITRWDEITKNFEGLVLKNKKTRHFFRWKKTVTGDYVVIGCNPSDAISHRGVASKGFSIGLYKNGRLEKLGDVGGKISFQMRKDMHNHPEKYIGKVIQVSGKAVFESGLLRSPQFERIRPDKSPEMCTMQQFDSV